MKIDIRTRYIDSRTGGILGIYTGNPDDFTVDSGGDKIPGVAKYTPPSPEDLVDGEYKKPARQRTQTKP